MDRIRFLHIPKTAGTSFTDTLARLYRGPRFRFSGDLQADRRRFRTVLPSHRENLVLVAGHSPKVTGIPQVDVLPTITFLRDPVRRVKSFCQHVSEGKSPDMLERFPPEQFDLDKFLASGDVQLSSFQTRMLLGEEGYALPQDDVEALVEAALNVLSEDMVGFGLVEEYDRSLVLFRRKLGWRSWPVYRTLNVRDHENLLIFSHDHLARIRQLNELNILVYERACELFQQELLRDSEYVTSSLALFERSQDLWNREGHRSEASIATRLAQGWGGRLSRAHHILRIDGAKGLGREVQQFLRWLSS